VPCYLAFRQAVRRKVQRSGTAEACARRRAFGTFQFISNVRHFCATERAFQDCKTELVEDVGLIMQERRKSARSRVLKGAKLVLGKSSVIDCRVRNATKAGARIQIGNTIELPEVLGLSFDGGHKVQPCRIAWRALTETGVEFL